MFIKDSRLKSSICVNIKKSKIWRWPYSFGRILKSSLWDIMYEIKFITKMRVIEWQYICKRFWNLSRCSFLLLRNWTATIHQFDWSTSLITFNFVNCLPVPFIYLDWYGKTAEKSFIPIFPQHSLWSLMNMSLWFGPRTRQHLNPVRMFRLSNL